MEYSDGLYLLFKEVPRAASVRGGVALSAVGALWVGAALLALRRVPRLAAVHAGGLIALAVTAGVAKPLAVVTLPRVGDVGRHFQGEEGQADCWRELLSVKSKDVQRG